ncbi:hypothetical protein CDL12_00176 [Handroanthus impetiginosus]|uniref:Myb/SANT-like domain-containing protein n=1 Tax=Handroanthus impetiginosus TaxID=429701 RepID=A0A2G9IBC7_9LAMI|nr:hypothetical protein CDL12_00176 [Handroanthus impetiginosus]
MDQSVCSSRSTNISKHLRRNPKRGLRHFWTPQEEAELIEALKSLHACGWKCNKSFKGGYMVRLEKIMAEKFPGCGILSKHIKSKLQVWKKDYGHILEILGSSGSAGPSINPNTHMIVVDSKLVWFDYIKVHPSATKLRGKPFPLHHSWVKIFRNDRAQGTGAIDIDDVLTDLLYGSQGKDTKISADNLFPLLRSFSSSERKMKATSFEGIESMVGTFLQETSSTIGSLVQQIRPPLSSGAPAQPTDSNLRKTLYVVLTEIPGLLIEERMLATHCLGKNDSIWMHFGEWT